MEPFRPIEEAKIILASASPRRSELLSQLGMEFQVIPSQIDEELEGELPIREAIAQLAYRKALEIAQAHPEADLVIGADTAVILCDEILGKPENRLDAFLMLGKLSNRAHQVITGFAVIDPKGDRKVVDSEVTQVTFRPLSHQEIEGYVATGEPLDKAGSYAIQGRGGIFVERIEGDYSNVVGLPIARIDQALRQLGWRIL